MFYNNKVRKLLSATLTSKEFIISLTSLIYKTNSNIHIEQLNNEIKKLYPNHDNFSFLGGRACLTAILKSIQQYNKKRTTVLLPAFTCQCVTNAIRNSGFKIRFIDIELDTFSMSAIELEKYIAKNKQQSEQLILFIQYSFGLICRDFEQLLQIARLNNILIIEDCAHALGARFKDRSVGTFGDVAFYSSERSKLINSIHGGFVITANKALSQALNKIHEASEYPSRNHQNKLLITLINEYIKAKRFSNLPIINSLPKILDKYCLPQMQDEEFKDISTKQYYQKTPNCIAQIISIQLQGLSKRQIQRKINAARLEQWARKKGFKCPMVIKDSEPAWLRYPILTDEGIKNNVIKNSQYFVKETNSEAGVWFLSPMHPKPFIVKNCPNGNKASKCVINLAVY